MTDKETIERLCGLVTEVGEHHHHKHTHDCFCGGNERCDVSEVLIEYIENAVREKAIRNPQLWRRGSKCGAGSCSGK